MKSIIIAGVLSASLLGLAAVPSYAASACKGIEQQACSTNAACEWRPALVKGETVTKAGHPSKVSRKAHCSLKRSTKAAKADCSAPRCSRGTYRPPPAPDTSARSPPSPLSVELSYGRYQRTH